MCAALVESGVERVAIERPDGLLVERLLEADLSVLAIHPNQLKAARPRFRAAGGKSDAFDAFVLAELARTDHHRFRALVPDSEETKALKALTRAREDLLGARVALANQLRAGLEAFWPGAARVFADVDSPISLAFSGSATRAPKTRAPPARNASLASSPATATAAAREPPISPSVCGKRPEAEWERPKRRHAGGSCSRWWPPSSRSSSR